MAKRKQEIDGAFLQECMKAHEEAEKSGRLHMLTNQPVRRINLEDQEKPKEN